MTLENACRPRQWREACVYEETAVITLPMLFPVSDTKKKLVVFIDLKKIRFKIKIFLHTFNHYYSRYSKD
jgi:hypothetical protein